MLLSEALKESRIKVDACKAEMKEVIKQHDEGLVTADEMAHKLVAKSEEILTVCIFVGGFTI
jgi:hypothetical protein